MARPMRSLMEPPGFWDSSLRNSWQGPVSMRVTSTIGVLPINENSAADDVGGTEAGCACCMVPPIAGLRADSGAAGWRLVGAAVPYEKSMIRRISAVGFGLQHR